MQDWKFDRLAKRVAEQPTRRKFLGGLGALIASGFAATAFGQRRLITDAASDIPPDSEEEMVALLEQLGQIAQDHNGTCEELTRKAMIFDETYRVRIERNLFEEKSWSEEHRALHADTYGGRRLAVVDQVQAAQERCQLFGMEPSSDDPLSTPVPREQATPMASPVAYVPGGMVTRSAQNRSLATELGVCTLENTNFMVEAYCANDHHGYWAGPSFQWPAYCPSGAIDDTCGLCEVNAKNENIDQFCHKVWPQDCSEYILAGPGLCEVKHHHGGGGVAGVNCDAIPANQETQARCYSSKSGWHSPEFSWPGYCPHGYIDHDCFMCSEGHGEQNPAWCEHWWPQDCHSDTYGNICYIGWHVNETVVCCEHTCPEHTGDCTLSVLIALSGDAMCGGCLVQLCGSTSHCLHLCEDSNVGCCKSACSRAVIPVIGASEGTPAATPIPDGSPASNATPIADETPTSEPASPTSEPASPTSGPASPTSGPASPTAEPASPTAAATDTPATATATGVPATETPTDVPATETPTDVPATATPTSTSTPTPTSAATPTSTPTPGQS